MRIVDYQVREMVIVPEADDVGKEFKLRAYHAVDVHVHITGSGIKEEFDKTKFGSAIRDLD